MRGLGGSLGHIVGDHVKKGAKGGASMAERKVMTKHLHAHADVTCTWTAGACMAPVTTTCVSAVFLQRARSTRVSSG